MPELDFLVARMTYLNLTYLKKCTPVKAKFRQVKALNLQS